MSLVDAKPLTSDFVFGGQVAHVWNVAGREATTSDFVFCRVAYVRDIRAQSKPANIWDVAGGCKAAHVRDFVFAAKLLTSGMSLVDAKPLTSGISSCRQIAYVRISEFSKPANIWDVAGGCKAAHAGISSLVAKLLTSGMSLVDAKPLTSGISSFVARLLTSGISELSNPLTSGISLVMRSRSSGISSFVARLRCPECQSSKQTR